MPRRTTILTVLFLGLILIALLRMLVGDPAGLHWPESASIHDARLLRLVAGCIVGASLAVAGVLLQSLMGNPLAAPDLMGVSSGASLGVAAAAFLAYTTGQALVASPAAQTGAALLGAFLALGTVLAWSHRPGGIDIISLVLVGVIVGMICSGGTLLLHHLMPDRGFAASAWLLGSINESIPRSLLVLSAVGLGLGFMLSIIFARAMDTAALAEDEARTLGIRMGRLRLVLFFVAGLLTTLSVMLAGPIGFVGLVIPHAVRIWIGPHHRPLLVGAALAGAGAIVGADAIVSALPLGHGRLPLGIITTLVGGPIFLLILRATLRGRSL